MLEFADAEIVPRVKIERKYRDAGKKDPPPANPVNIEIPPDIHDLDMTRALKLALERERDSESHYRFMAERAQNGSELEALFFELAEIEWKHKTDLQAEYESQMTDPEQF